MFACGRFFVRAGPNLLVREVNAAIRGSLGHNRQNYLCMSAAVLVAAATKPASSPAEPIKKNGSLPKVETTFCGFPKDLVAGPSCVVGSDVFGDDACFVASFKSTHVAGVADGVGGWRSYGVNPSEFSSKFMRHCAEIVRHGDFEPTRPDLVIAKAYNRLKAAPRPIGSSTACVVIVHQKTLYSANLGDSGYLVCRKGKTIHRSKEQTHYFNAPFQLTLLPEDSELEGIIMDKPEQSDLYELELESGDVVILATDGLWDNVPETVILEALSGVEPANLQATCNSIALIARRLSRDEEYASPFALKACNHGYKTVGGKPDDITLVLMYIS